MIRFDTSIVWPILRLAWKLSRRRWERQSPLLGGLAVLVAVVGIGSAVVAAVMALVLGIALLPEAEPLVLMLVWDGVIAVFLLLWLTGLLIQLQLGGESLSLDKLLHMPVSVSSAFFVNFLGSQLRVSLIIFLGVMLGLAAASVTVLGAAHLVLFPLVLGLAALVTCVTHQFQSWLGRVFANKRRRGTVVAVAVLAFVVLANLPALLNRSLVGADVSWGMEQVGQWALVANALFPPGWLALGAWGAADGGVWISALATVGMFGIALLSLRRSYRKTLGAIARDDRPGQRPARAEDRTKPATRSAAPTAGLAFGMPPGLGRMLDPIMRSVPDHSRAVAWVAVRLWIRGPQGKMVLLSPLLLIMLYLVIFRDFTQGGWAAQFVVLAMMGFMIMMAFNLFSNVFGQDGNGFRTVVLASVPPTELLLGKNLALLPYALVIGSVIIAVLQWVHPLPPTHVLANFAQLLVLYLVGCMLGNSFSVRAPWPMSSTSMGMRNATAASFLASFLSLLLLVAFIAPLAIPLALERRLAQGGSSIPLYLIFSILELAVVVFVYRRLLASKGRLLATRLESILVRVTQPVD
ncbi:MAG: hypothetical protein OXI79_02365 [Gammaproteobacteria bacterium]|nr:hypothetical protein [Gammaproteobacteria bacterium]